MRKMVFLLTVLIVAGAFILLQNLGMVNAPSPAAKILEFKALTALDGGATDNQPFRALILADDRSDFSMETARNMQAVTGQMKMSTDLHLLSGSLPELSQYDLILFSGLLDSGFTEVIDALLAYTSSGGKVFFTDLVDWNSALNIYFSDLGILEFENIQTRIKESETITVESDFLPTVPKGTSLSGWATQNLVVQLTLKSNATVHMSANVDSTSVPILWSLGYGKGELMVATSNMMREKHNRGVIAGAVCTLLGEYIYPVYDAITIFIDDFPAPIQNGYNDTISAEYNRDIAAFFQDVWWPEMAAIGKVYRVGYTGLLVSTYNDKVAPPFERQGDYTQHKTFAASLVQNGWEVGLHGYNHNSLMLEASYRGAKPLYPPWPDQETMELSLQELLGLGGDLIKDYGFTTYVPPSNILSQEGRQAVVNAFPDLYVISGHYLTDESEMGVYTQEFGVDEDGVVNLPRLSSGMIPNASEEWLVLNGMAMYGVVSHFIHPDDVLDSQRSYGLSWSELYKGFDAYLTSIRKAMPDIRGMTSTETAIEIERVERLGMRPKFGERRLDVSLTGFVGETHFFLRLPAPPLETEGCTVAAINDFNHLYYVVTVTSPDFWIEW